MYPNLETYNFKVTHGIIWYPNIVKKVSTLKNFRNNPVFDPSDIKNSKK